MKATAKMKTKMKESTAAASNPMDLQVRFDQLLGLRKCPPKTAPASPPLLHKKKMPPTLELGTLAKDSPKHP
jgi:hypothetical protein